MSNKKDNNPVELTACSLQVFGKGCAGLKPIKAAAHFHVPSQKMSESTREHTIVFKTGKLHELDMASNALSDEGIPFFKQTGSSSGVRLAMSFQPAMGPGTWYSILVSDQVVEQAKVVLSNLPIEIDTDPDVWHFGNSEKQKRWWKIFTWFMLTLVALFLGAYIYNLF